MTNLLRVTLIACILPGFSACRAQDEAPTLRTGAERLEVYAPLLGNRSVGVVANHSSMVGTKHLVDTLISSGIDVKAIFSPEHGFRGLADAGQVIGQERDEKTGLPVYSLYGNRKKPDPDMLQGLDIILFDLQDVGTRFYTYISTMHYVMEACAEQGIPLIVLDRPDPNGFYVDGPVLDPQYSSFVGMHPVPVVHGMTIGEYALMVNGEGWLKEGARCDLKVIQVEGWTHDSLYVLPIRPSPNLPGMTSVYLYPSLCLFEGTALSVGRGTDGPFTRIGHPTMKGLPFSFVPAPMPGAMKPKLQGQTCYGWSFSDSLSTVLSDPYLRIEWLVKAYKAYPDKSTFFIPFFDKLAGSDSLRKQIVEGMDAAAIRASWKEGIDSFMLIRGKYLLYEDAAGLRSN